MENVINDLAKREIHKTSSTIPCTEKWSEYYTCKECKDEVNRKGHLTKPQEADFFSSCIHCNFVFITFLNDLQHSMHGTWFIMKFSKLKIVFFNILHINYLLGFRKMTFTIHLIFTSPAGMKFRTLFTPFCSCLL